LGYQIKGNIKDKDKNVTSNLQNNFSFMQRTAKPHAAHQTPTVMSLKAGSALSVPPSVG
jgi:hypothetical protein